MTSEKITLSQLEQYLSKAAWILKGPVDASDFKVYIFPLLFFKRISDVYDEEYRVALEESDGDEAYAALPEMHRFEIPQGCHWQDIRETRLLRPVSRGCPARRRGFSRTACPCTLVLGADCVPVPRHSPCRCVAPQR